MPSISSSIDLPPQSSTSARNAVSSLSKAPATPEAVKGGNLPTEIWKLVVESLGSKDLKSARLINHAWKDFATPFLYRTIVFSPEPANIKNLQTLSKQRHLVKHVEHLYLDATTHDTIVDPERYAKLASRYFGTVFGLGKQSTGPLSEKNLYELLITDSSKRLGARFLSGRPRGHFVAGYTLYNARMYHALAMYRADRVYQILNDVLPKFPNLKHLETMSHWTEADTPYQDDFKTYLRETLPEKTLRLIAGVPPTSLKGQHTIANTSAFAAPGTAARELNMMIVPPHSSGCYGTEQWHEITRATLRVIRDNNIKLKTLKLPGADFLGHEAECKSRSGLVAMRTLLEGAKAPGASRITTLLLPLFRTLRVLELNIDFNHPGSSQTPHGDYQRNRVRNAIQQMKDLESLSLGAKNHSAGPRGPWNLTELMLWKKEDHEADDTNDDNDGPTNPPLDVVQNITDLFNVMLGGAPPGGNPGTDHAGGSQAQNGPAVGPNAGPVMGGASITVGGITTPVPPFLTQMFGNPHGHEGSDAGKSKTTPKTALSPNPWPKLRYLSLWNLPTTPEELTRLARTVKSSLRVLKLDGLYFEDNRSEGPFPLHAHDGGPEDALMDDLIDPTHDLYGDSDDDDGDEMPGLVNMSGQSVAAPNPSTDEDDDMPTLVDMSGASAEVSAPSTGNSAGSSSNETGAASSTSTPAPGAAQSAPQATSSINPSMTTDTEPARPDVCEKWFSTIEMLADELRLDGCDLEFRGDDEATLRLKLNKTIDGLYRLPSIGHLAAHYLLDGNGVGFTLYLVNEIKTAAETEMNDKIEAKKLAEDEGSDEWEEDEEDEDYGDDDDDLSQYYEDDAEDARHELYKLKTGRKNIHICSTWQACPNGSRKV